MIWTRLVGQTLAAAGCGVSAVSGPIIVHADAVAAITASAADLNALRLCTLSPPAPAEACNAADRRRCEPSRSLFAPPPSRRWRARAALAREHDEFRVAAGFPAEALVGDHQR